MKRYLVLCLLFIHLFPTNVLAWSAGGHRVVAFIAWLQLDAQTRQKAVEMIKKHERFNQDFVNRMPVSVAASSQSVQDQWFFLQASVWPDIARGFSGQLRQEFHRAKWHYVNFPIFAREQDADVIDLSDVNLETQLPSPIGDEKDLNVIQALQLNRQVLLDANSTDEDKAVHFCWAFHLIGDIHQPLHSTAMFSPTLFPDGDRGAT